MKPCRLAFLAVVATALAAGDAGAAERTLRVSDTTAAQCHGQWRAGQPGVATSEVKVPGPGVIDGTLNAADGDWDVALFDASGRDVGAAASPGSREITNGFLLAGETVRVQACRRDGAAESATFSLSHTKFPDAKAEKVQLVDVKTPTRAHKDRLVSLGFDMTEHGHEGALGVVLHGEKDAERLRRAGFEYEVEVADLGARTRRDAIADRRFAQATKRSDLPSGRDEYRVLADYENEMKALAAANPGLVRMFELPNRTWQGRTVKGLEITTDVNVSSGKPGFLNMGIHHAREWPSGEHAMEWAYELVNGFKNGNARTQNIVRNSRNFIVPVVNPDGFNASRSAGAASGGDGGRDESVPDTALIVGGTANGGEYRRKNCRIPNQDAGNCLTSAGLAENGVDPNRNYGGLWGGPGADQTNPLAQTFPGTEPFSEPETRNIKALVGSNQITTLITNHTTAGLVLRAPGLAALGDPVDEGRGYKQLGDDMGLQNGYFSQKSFELYDTTGTTEDWTYNTAGGYGFTFEIYCGDPNYATGDCDDPAFHPLFETMVKEWDGSSPQSNHENDPGRSEANPFGRVADYNGGGNREAYYIAAESTLNEARHSVIEGQAPAGATLRLRKTFKTETFPQEDNDDKPIFFDDSLESTMQVDATGTFRWHTNPSTRPIVAKERGDRGGGEPAPPEEQQGAELGGSGTDPANEDNSAIPCADANAPTPLCWNEHLITVPNSGDNRSANIRVVWPSPASDWDVKLFEDTNDDGDTGAGDKEVGVSEQGATSEEEVGIVGTPRLQAGKKYLLRVTNFAAGEPYDVQIRWNGPEPFKPAQVEAFTMTCEVGGQVLQTTNVTVDRGQVARPNLDECLQRSRPAAVPAPTQQDTCVAGGGFRSATARGQSRRVAFSFARKVRNPVTVDVFQQSIGRRVIGERLMARFGNRSSGFTWNGRANRSGRRVSDGYYFLRYTMAQPGGGKDVRRVTLRRVKGRWTTRAAFHRPDSCGAVRSFKLTRPVFGGRNNRELGVSFRLLRAGRARVEVLRGTKVVKTFASTQRRAGVTHRLRLPAKGLRRGDYKFRLSLVEGGRTTRLTLTSRRL